MTKDEALKLALEAFKEINYDQAYANEIAAIREALAQPEPVIDKSAAIRIATALGWTPHRKPLTDEQLQEIADKCRLYPRDFARAIEAAHGIKE